MKRIILILVLFSATIALSQTKTFEEEVQKISKNIDRITEQQKDSLKLKVKLINLQFEKGELSAEESEKQKKEAAQYHARRIEELVNIQQIKLQKLVQDKTDGKIVGEDVYYDEDVFTIRGKTFQLRLKNEDDEFVKNRKRKRAQNKWGRRTTSDFIFATGVNNVLENNKLSYLEDSPYQFWRSRFYEVGFALKYRLSKKPSKFYLKYGFSFLWNNLRAENNQYHVVNGDQTELQEFTFPTTESRLRHVQMIFPLHLEVDFSKSRKKDNGDVYDRRGKSWRIGVGGFVGFKMGTRQYLEYTNESGVRIEELQKNNFNMNRYHYGISSYIAHKDIGFYVKYDLNPLFKETEIRNISMGVRFDL